jgi:hypothetical protein
MTQRRFSLSRSLLTTASAVAFAVLLSAPASAQWSGRGGGPSPGIGGGHPSRSGGWQGSRWYGGGYYGGRWYGSGWYDGAWPGFALGLGLGALALSPYVYAPYYAPPPAYYAPPPAYYPPPPGYYPPPGYVPPQNMPPGTVIY